MGKGGGQHGHMDLPSSFEPSGQTCRSPEISDSYLRLQQGRHKFRSQRTHPKTFAGGGPRLPRVWPRNAWASELSTPFPGTGP
eukprot:1240982-Pyramimonas_sp.AAC.1